MHLYHQRVPLKMRHSKHLIWSDGTYNMVKIQQEMKYDRPSGVDLGPINVVAFTKTFGATGFELTGIEQFSLILQRAREAESPILMNLPTDYSDKESLIAFKDPYHGH